MANIDAPFGLRPIAKLGSAPGGTTGTTKYKISSGASALFTGDPVKLKADGSIEVKGALELSLEQLVVYSWVVSTQIQLQENRRSETIILTG